MAYAETRTGYNLGHVARTRPDLLVVGVRPELEPSLQRRLELGHLVVVADAETAAVDQDLPTDTEDQPLG